MSQRESGYARVERDKYETPEWVTQALMPHLGRCLHIWEPACGSGKMVRALESAGHEVTPTDIESGADFLLQSPGPVIDRMNFDAIVTNPPYALAYEFITHALEICPEGVVAMLLRADYDHAATREHLFKFHKRFSKKVALTRRIIWFDAPGAAPSFNHAWYIWDHRHTGAPTLAYGP